MAFPEPVLPWTTEKAAPPTDFCKSPVEPAQIVVPAAWRHVGELETRVRFTKLVPPLVETPSPRAVAA